MKLDNSKKLSEANIQAEIYHRLKLKGIDCFLEVTFDIGHRDIRADIVVVKGDDVLCLIECKRGGNKVDESSRQYKGYIASGLPFMYCLNYSEIDMVVVAIEKMMNGDVDYVTEMLLEGSGDDNKVDKNKLNSVKRKKSGSKSSQLDKLISSGISYSGFNDNHYRLSTDLGDIDLWITTKKWRFTKGGKTMTGGVDAILDMINSL